MTKSQIFLGASAFVLALAGAFASKASYRLQTITVATKGAMGDKCLNIQQIQATTINSGNLNKARTVNGGRTFVTVRRVNDALVCGKTVYTKPE